MKVGGCSETVSRFTARPIRQIAVFSRHPPVRQKSAWLFKVAIHCATILKRVSDALGRWFKRLEKNYSKYKELRPVEKHPINKITCLSCRNKKAGTINIPAFWNDADRLKRVFIGTFLLSFSAKLPERRQKVLPAGQGLLSPVDFSVIFAAVRSF